ncbi:hypothetical protein ASZ78_011201 [Callipepla squamata]|uniref:PID domain-containing protein n=1 Tax=Callipepla squamata TaxID=9009 RepID=A0A226N6Z5_CALSU|nr:hypothetical protein ASZ78_011201 [Callipepla squamata]
MRERGPQSLGAHVLYVGPLRHPGMLHRAKYSRFRNDSVTSLDEGPQNVKGSSSHPPAPNLLAEDVPLGAQDACTTLCALIPRVANIKLANPSALPGLKSFCLGSKELPRTKLTECVTVPGGPSSPELGCLAASYPQPGPEGPQLSPGPTGGCAGRGAAEAVDRMGGDLVPSREHTEQPGTTYGVRVSTGCGDRALPQLAQGTAARAATSAAPGHRLNLRCIGLSWIQICCSPCAGAEVWDGLFRSKLKSKGKCARVHIGAPSSCLQSLFIISCKEMRKDVHLLEAISRLCEAVSGTNGAVKKRKPPVKFLSSVLGKSNLQFSGVNIKLTISTNSLTLINVDTQQIIANHHMQSISFASGGDPDTTDYVAYVAKDPVNQRACHILECPNGMAQEVINTIGQAFELRFKQYLKNPSSLVTSNERFIPLRQEARGIILNVDTLDTLVNNALASHGSGLSGAKTISLKPEP